MSYPLSMGFIRTLCLVFALTATCARAAEVPSLEPVVTQVGASPSHIKSASHNISIVGNEFMLDGQPLHIVSGSLHYFRLPSAYWRDRLRKLKAAGLNAVSTYVEWSYHEPEERQYNFKGDRDVAAFVRAAAAEGLHVLLRPGPYICAERDLYKFKGNRDVAAFVRAAAAEGLHVLLRPGPYICAERDLGGFPYWLLGKYPNIKLRTTDSDFIRESEIWLEKLFQELTPLLFGNGGPIILVQVENEYGSYGDSKPYKEKSRDILLKHIGRNALLYTTDGTYPAMFLGGAVDGALTTIDFGTGTNVTHAFRTLRRYMPEGPLMNSEYYPGWLTHWGEHIQQVDTQDVVRNLREMLSQHVNVNFYVFFGGSNFEYSAGANYGNSYTPDITSYDYDAPLTEAGDPTPKYYAIRDVLKQYNFEAKDIPEPTPSSKGAYGTVTVTPRIELLSSLGRTMLAKKYPDVTGATLPHFEKLRQRSGLVLYETKLKEGKGVLEIQKPRDWIYVYVDGELKGAINRMYRRKQLSIQSKADSVLSLLVENQGRINYGSHLHDRKGILSTVTYNGETLNGQWSVSGYPLELLYRYDADFENQPNLSKGPVLFEGEFTLPEGDQPLDTFLDTTGWGRGYVWVNGNNLGRYWPGLGPQVTLYVPGVWLKAAPLTNCLQILELESAPEKYTMEFIDYPILNRTANFR